MKNNCRDAVIVATWVALVLTLAACGTAGAKDSAPPQDSWAKYQIILERNIFSRQRRPARRPEEEKEAVVVVPNPETHFVLKGIAQENEEFLAFIEDTQTGAVLRLHQGERVARGTIKALNLDGIEYQLDDHTTAVKLGYDLEGTLAPVAAVPVVSQPAPAASVPAGGPTPPPAASPSVTPPTGSSPAPAGDEADILRRLMEQRRQQLGQ